MAPALLPQRVDDDHILAYIYIHKNIITPRPRLYALACANKFIWSEITKTCHI